jgi:hypothetical protein
MRDSPRQVVYDRWATLSSFRSMAAMTVWWRTILFHEKFAVPKLCQELRSQNGVGLGKRRRSKECLL